MSSDLPVLLADINRDHWADHMEPIEATKPTVGADAKLVVFATNVCVVSCKSKRGDNVRFKLWPNCTVRVRKKRGLKLVDRLVVGAIDKEFDCDIARSLVLW